MTSDGRSVHVELCLYHAPDGTPAVHVQRLDDGADLGVVWLTELAVVLEALLLEEEDRTVERHVHDGCRGPEQHGRL